MKPSDTPATTTTERLRNFAGRIRHGLDALVHPIRRRRAIRSLTQPPPSSVVFICHGNICRSPFAAAAFLKTLPDFLSPRFTVTSSGFIGPGRGTPQLGIDAALRRGIDLSGHRSDVFTPESIRAADLIVVMEPQQQRRLQPFGPGGGTTLVLGDLDPLPITRRTIADPWNGKAEDFDDSYERIQRCIDVLVKTLTNPD